jgi:hypothetical protein
MRRKSFFLANPVLGTNWGQRRDSVGFALPLRSLPFGPAEARELFGGNYGIARTTLGSLSHRLPLRRRQLAPAADGGGTRGPPAGTGWRRTSGSWNAAGWNCHPALTCRPSCFPRELIAQLQLGCDPLTWGGGGGMEVVCTAFSAVADRPGRAIGIIPSQGSLLQGTYG